MSASLQRLITQYLSGFKNYSVSAACFLDCSGRNNQCASIHDSRNIHSSHRPCLKNNNDVGVSLAFSKVERSQRPKPRLCLFRPNHHDSIFYKLYQSHKCQSPSQSQSSRFYLPQNEIRCRPSGHDDGNSGKNGDSVRDKLGLATLAIFGGLFGLSDEEKEMQKKDPLIYAIRKAILAERKNELTDADSLYHQALLVTAELEASDDIPKKRAMQARVYIFDRLANLSLARGKIENAEKLFKETLKGLLQLKYEKNDNALMEITIKLAMCHALLDKLEEAERGYEYCIENMEAKLKEARKTKDKKESLDPDLVALTGMSYDAYSRFLLVQNRSPEALKMSERSLELAREVLGDDHPQIAVLLSDRATQFTMTGKYNQAEDLLQRAVKMAESTKSEDLPVYLCNLGAVLSELNKFDEAAKACKRAQRLGEKNKSEAAVSQAQNCLGHIENKRKKMDM